MKASRLPIGELEQSLSSWLRIASNRVAHAFQQKVGLSVVSFSEYEVLRLAQQLEVTSSSELGQLVGLSKGAMSKLLDRLVDKGFIARFDDEDDGRGQVFQLTVSGREIVLVLVSLAVQLDEEFFGHLSEDRKSELLRVLKRVADR